MSLLTDEQPRTFHLIAAEWWSDEDPPVYYICFKQFMPRFNQLLTTIKQKSFNGTGKNCLEDEKAVNINNNVTITVVERTLLLSKVYLVCGN